ncbi:alpha/beta-hydrolase [Schizophyllum commune H4-8]|nr:alpha/beta-hydrolase [Schizophyllum commune H4-8]KAI5885023.1 alpha/beta-hydrolase [Schizophyllum commune H4-8]
MTIATTALTLAALIAASPSVNERATSSTISWASCTTLDWRYAIGDPLNITCGFFEVPMDYGDASVGACNADASVGAWTVWGCRCRFVHERMWFGEEEKVRERWRRERGREKWRQEGAVQTRDRSGPKARTQALNPPTGTAKLAVARYPAQGERKGTVFVNPGGPGGSGVAFVLGYGPDLAAMVGGGYDAMDGGGYDMVSWDPRGVGHTEPGAPGCLTDEEWNELFEGTMETEGLDIRGNLSDGDQLTEFYSHVDEMEAKYRALGQKCAEADSAANLPYLGTAAAARDMAALADYLDPGAQEINYWGFSYGSMLGFVFVNMFPDRVGHVVLDGCMNPLLYANKPTTEYFPNDVVDADEAFEGFTTACALAGPGSCALAKNTTNSGKNETDSSEGIKERVQGMLDLAHTLAASGADLSDTMTSAQARTYLFEALAEPTSWASLAGYLEAYGEKLQGMAANSTSDNSTSTTNSSARSKGSSSSTPEAHASFKHRWQIPTRSLADSTPSKRQVAPSKRQVAPSKRQVAPSEPHTYEFEAIYCGDGVDADTVPDSSSPPNFDMTMRGGFEAIAYASTNVSAMFGPQWGAQGNLCFAWPARAVERYTGPWDKELKNKVLVIGTTADPVTPFENAQLMADLLGDSAVLVRQNGFGHASLAEKSSCTIGVVSRYFQDGELPTGDDTVCEIDDSVVLFPDSDVTQARVKSEILAASAV